MAVELPVLLRFVSVVAASKTSRRILISEPRTTDPSLDTKRMSIVVNMLQVVARSRARIRKTTLWTSMTCAANGAETYWRKRTSLLVASESVKLTVVIADPALVVEVGKRAAIVVSSQPALNAGETAAEPVEGK